MFFLSLNRNIFFSKVGEILKSRMGLGLLFCFLLWGMEGKAQPTVRSGEVDIFMGVDLNYRDIMFSKPYELLVNLTPGVKWNMGRQWQVAAQAGWTASTPVRWTVPVGADVYLNRWNTQLRLRGGRFVYEDYGVVPDWEVRLL